MKKKIIFSFFSIVLIAFVAMILGDAETATGAISNLSSDGASMSSYASMGLLAVGGGQRAVYDKAIKRFPDKTVVPGFLRVEQELKNGNTNYKFNFTKGEGGADSALEVKLNRTDEFLITHLGFFLVKKNSDLPNCEVLQTYPNKTVFADGVANFKSEFLEAFYNGSFDLKVKSKTFMEEMDLQQFRNVGAMAQSSAATYSEQNALSGFIPTTPNIKITANDPHSIGIKLPVVDGLYMATDEAKMTNYVVVVARGFLIKE